MEIKIIKTKWSETDLKQNSYVLIGDDACVVIDAGASLNDVKAVCNKPIEAVFVTHGHFDHIQYIEQYDELDIPIYINPKTKDFLSDPIKNVSSLTERKLTFKCKNLKVIKDKEVVEVLNTTMKCFFTPGHSEDCTCYLFDNSILFSGDTLFSIAVGRTDLATSDFNVLIESLKFLKTLKFDLLYSGHGRASNYEEQEKNIQKWIDELEDRQQLKNLQKTVDICFEV